MHVFMKKILLVHDHGLSETIPYVCPKQGAKLEL